LPTPTMATLTFFLGMSAPLDSPPVLLCAVLVR
jgi:hypothetical protein